MTYVRDPLTFEAALDMIVARLGLPAVVQLVGKAPRTIAGWSNPVCDQTPQIETALALDCAWRASGGAGAPMLDTYRRLFDASAPSAILIAEMTLPDATVACIKESAEAKSALVLAMRPGATARDRRNAAREVIEDIAALETALIIVQQPP